MLGRNILVFKIIRNLFSGRSLMESRASKKDIDINHVLDFDTQSEETQLPLEEILKRFGNFKTPEEIDKSLNSEIDSGYVDSQQRLIVESIKRYQESVQNRKSIDKYSMDYLRKNNHICLVELLVPNDSPPKPLLNALPLEFEKFTPPILFDYPDLPWGKPAKESDNYWANAMKTIGEFVKLDNDKITLVEIEELIKNLLINDADSARATRQFIALEKLFKESNANGKQQIVSTIKFIAGLVTRSPRLFPKGIPLLKKISKYEVQELYPDKRMDCTITLSQEQCAIILANAFFGILQRWERSSKFNRFNFVNIMSGVHKQSIEKLKFVFEYFSKISKSMPTGVVSFRRISYGETLSDKDRVSLSNNKISDCILSVSANEKIEDFEGHRHVDFANSYIGGGVLGPMGSAQEEISFLMKPEAIVSCLLCERMDENEAIEIIGAQRYSSYSGYGNSLKFKQYDSFGSEKRDAFGRIDSTILAIDAVSQGREIYKQFAPNAIRRELRKCLIGFEACDREDLARKPIATGNWGCGAFRGDPQLKFLIQLLVASLLKVPLSYSTFGDPKLARQLQNVYRLLCEKSMTTRQLYELMVSYKAVTGCKSDLFKFLMGQL